MGFVRRTERGTGRARHRRKQESSTEVRVAADAARLRSTVRDSARSLTEGLI
jgi:hypothetical protein